MLFFSPVNSGVIMEHQTQKQEQKQSLKHKLFEIYDKKYKLLLVIPFLMLILALSQIAYQVSTTGDFIKKDVSLKGGVTITIPYDKSVDVRQIENEVSSGFPKNDIAVRTLRSATSVEGII